MHRLLLAILLMCSAVAQQDKRMVLVQHNLPARPWQIDAQNTFAHIDSLPFEGFAYNRPMTLDLFRGDYNFTEADVENQLGSFDSSIQNLDQNSISLVIRQRRGLPTAL